MSRSVLVVFFFVVLALFNSNLKGQSADAKNILDKARAHEASLPAYTTLVKIGTLTNGQEVYRRTTIFRDSGDVILARTEIAVRQHDNFAISHVRIKTRTDLWLLSKKIAIRIPDQLVGSTANESVQDLIAIEGAGSAGMTYSMRPAPGKNVNLIVINENFSEAQKKIFGPLLEGRIATLENRDLLPRGAAEATVQQWQPKRIEFLVDTRIMFIIGYRLFSEAERNIKSVLYERVDLNPTVDKTLFSVPTGWPQFFPKDQNEYELILKQYSIKP
jgi:hypothetical protein